VEDFAQVSEPLELHENTSLEFNFMTCAQTLELHMYALHLRKSDKDRYAYSSAHRAPHIGVALNVCDVMINLHFLMNAHECRTLTAA
jgi:hypothetical protein